MKIEKWKWYCASDVLNGCLQIEVAISTVYFVSCLREYEKLSIIALLCQLTCWGTEKAGLLMAKTKVISCISV